MPEQKENELSLNRDYSGLLRNRNKSARVYVVGGGFPYIQMFDAMGAVGARDVKDADLICFTGGADVSPEFYDEQEHPQSHCSRERDDVEANIYWAAYGLDKPMVGICRGGQFLNVMNGGRMWQHVNNHTYNHAILDMASGQMVPAMTSTHHQMMIPGTNANILATAGISTTKEKVVAGVVTKVVCDPDAFEDIEALYYEDTRSLCFQPHPEFYQGTCRDYFSHLLDTHIVPLL